MWWLSVPLLPFKMGAFVLPDLLKGAGGAQPTLADVLSLGLLIAANVCGQVASGTMPPVRLIDSSAE